MSISGFFRAPHLPCLFLCSQKTNKFYWHWVVLLNRLWRLSFCLQRGYRVFEWRRTHIFNRRRRTLQIHRRDVRVRINQNKHYTHQDGSVTTKHTNDIIVLTGKHSDCHARRHCDTFNFAINMRLTNGENIVYYYYVSGLDPNTYLYSNTKNCCIWNGNHKRGRHLILVLYLKSICKYTENYPFKKNSVEKQLSMKFI